MGESACLMQPFSYVSGINHDPQEGNQIHGLGQSISFGRFMSESLAWEKWSTFSHNRYVEEAERYSRPGSVAEKKAFFEAHYKKIAARKAAALLEQAKSESKSVPGSEFEGQVHDLTIQDSQMKSLDTQVAADEQQETNASFIVDANKSNLKVETDLYEVEGANAVTEHKVLTENRAAVKPTSQIGDESNREEVKEMELSGTTQRGNRVETEPPSQLEVLDNGKKCGEAKLSEAAIDEALLKRFSTNQDYSVLIGNKKQTVSSSGSLNCNIVSKQPPSPAKFTAPGRPKENITTPISTKSTTNSTRKLTPKSVHKSMNFTPAKELNRLTSTIIQKVDDSKVGSNSKASKNCSTPLRTPTTVSVTKPMSTPWSENIRTPLDSSVSASKTVRAKWHFLPTDFSKFLSPRRNKPQSPKVSTPFGLRTEERAARRKEKLEKKFNADTTNTEQLQASLKEKAETELQKLRKSLCFKARPLPDFYKERGTPKKQTKKSPVTQPQSPKLGRRSTANIAQCTTNQLFQRPQSKTTGQKHAAGKNTRTPTCSLISRLTRIAHENTCPNIQRGMTKNQEI